MAQFVFSVLANGQHVAFDPEVDVLLFGAAADSAGAVRLNTSGANLGFTLAGKTVWLDATVIGQISEANVSFANGSRLLVGDGTTDLLADWYGGNYTALASSTVGNQVWGLGGADLVQTGSGSDYLVGNPALTPLNHVSRVGAVGAPTAASNPSISADGRFVAFEGGWTQFGSTSNSGTDVLVKDLATGLVSNEHESSAGTNGNSGSGAPVISADGRVAAFLSASSNLVPGPSSDALYDIYVAQVAGTGIERVSTGNGGALATGGQSLDPDLSRDGRYVAFESSNASWAAGGSDAQTDIFVKDRVSGSLTRVSTSISGGDGNAESRSAKISADGRFVVFQSAASNLTAGDTNGRIDVFVWDGSDGSLTNLSSFDPLTTTNPASDALAPDVAFDNGWGGVIVFETAKGLAGTDTNNATDIYAFDLQSQQFQLVSSRADGSGVQVSSTGASVSGDGRFVAFTSFSDQLVPGDANGTRDVFVKDLFTGEIALVSKSASGAAGNNASYNAEISLGGDWIVFESAAGNLAGTDGNGFFSDVFRVSNPLLKDILIGGTGNDTYVISRPDILVEQPDGGTDTVVASISYVLGANLENLTLAGTANLNGTGNGLNNVIAGNGGNNVLNGGAGVDTVSYAGAAAAVTVNLASAIAQNTLGAGSDTLLNFENLSGSSFNDTLNGNGLANVINGGLGNDTLSGGAGNDTYVVNSIADIIVEAADGGIDTVQSAVTWTLQPTLENLSLTGAATINGTGNSAANVIAGNGANNVLNGGAGVDTVSYAGAAAAVTVNLASAVAQNTVGAGSDTLLNFENLSGSNFNDTLSGNALANVINGGLGNDTLSGGAGNDTYVVNSIADIIVEAADGGIDTVQSAVTWTLQPTLENLSLTGAATINGTGNSAANVIAGNGANNVLNGGAGVDTVSYAGAAAAVTVNLASAGAQNTVGAGSDTLLNFENLSGSNFNDTLSGNALANVINGGLGNDTLNGGAGNDIYVVNSIADIIVEAVDGGIDTVQSAVTWTLQATLENLSLTGAAAINGTGNSAANVIAGNGANNVLNGGAGVDTVSYAGAAAAVTVNLASAGAQNTVGAGSDMLLNFENLSGSNFNDTLSGNALANVINGGPGNDTLNGGLGDDRMSGGAGADQFVFASRLGTDTITDFVSGTDKFRFSQAGLRIGDGDTAVDGAVTAPGPGGFGPASELVIVQGNAASLTAVDAASAIGSANAAYAPGVTRLFAVDTGAQTGVFLFTSSGADAVVSAAELTQLAVATSTPGTAIADYLFVA